MSQEQQSKPITITFADNSTMSKVVSHFVRDKPIGWSHKSYAPYYKRAYADWIKKDIDEMISTRNTIVYPYDKWPKIKGNGLYLRVNQALLFLLEPKNEMDSDGKYAKFREQVSIRRERGKGIIIEFDEVLEGSSRAEMIMSDRDKPKWKLKMDEWLESNAVNQPPFYQKNLLLTPEEVEEIKSELEGLTNIIHDITSREIKIIKG